MRHPSWLEIDLHALRGNVRWWRRLLEPQAGKPQSERPLLAAVVKADAYGLGAVPISRCLADAGVDFLIVYSLDQANELLAAAIPTPLLVLMPVSQIARGRRLREATAQGRLHLSVDDLRQMRALDAAGRRLGCRLPIHLHVDTGMSRAGLSAAQFEEALPRLDGQTGLRLAGVYSHLATAPTDPEHIDEQSARLDEILAPLRPRLPAGTLVHVSSTYAACRDRRYHRGLVRIGLGLYGYGPEAVRGQLLPHDGWPQPVVRWRSRIVHLQRYPAAAAVGYERSYVLRRESVLGIVPAGYGDGYPVGLSNKSSVGILGAGGQAVGHAPQRGQVNMDQIIIDLTDLPEARVGTTVELLSADHSSPCSAAALAGLAGTSCYEILCRLSPRLPRVLLDDAAAAPRAGPKVAISRA